MHEVVYVPGRDRGARRAAVAAICALKADIGVPSLLFEPRTDAYWRGSGLVEGWNLPSHEKRILNVISEMTRDAPDPKVVAWHLRQDSASLFTTTWPKCSMASLSCLWVPVATDSTDSRTWEHKALRFCVSYRGSLRAQDEHPCHDSLYLGIGRNQPFAVHFPDRYMDCPLVLDDLSQTVQRQVDTFADAHPYGADEQDCIGLQRVDAAQFLLQG